MTEAGTRYNRCQASQGATYMYLYSISVDWKLVDGRQCCRNGRLPVCNATAAELWHPKTVFEEKNAVVGGLFCYYANRKRPTRPEGSSLDVVRPRGGA